LIWNNWERFNGEQDNPGDSTDYNIPLIAVKPEVNSVADYFGLSYLSYFLLSYSAYFLLSYLSYFLLSTNIGTIRPESQVNLEP
jgi:hypothetical protein